MKKIIGGALSIILGLICFSIFPQAFFNLLTGIIPLILITAGCLAIYLKHEDESDGEEETDSWNNTDASETMPPAVPAETGLEEAVITAPADDSLTLLGNTGSLVFHTSDCNFSKSKHCTEVFTSREKAIQEGYKPCGICNP